MWLIGFGSIGVVVAIFTTQQVIFNKSIVVYQEETERWKGANSDRVQYLQGRIINLEKKMQLTKGDGGQWHDII